MAIQDMAFDPLKPYNNLPPLPPKADIETKAILKKAITAIRGDRYSEYAQSGEGEPLSEYEAL